MKFLQQKQRWRKTYLFKLPDLGETSLPERSPDIRNLHDIVRGELDWLGAGIEGAEKKFIQGRCTITVRSQNGVIDMLFEGSKMDGRAVIDQAGKNVLKVFPLDPGDTDLNPGTAQRLLDQIIGGEILPVKENE